MKKVTLAMPIYNVEGYIERALVSALNQTYGNIEFIVVDDKGSDNSMEIVRRIIEAHPRGNDVRIIDHIVNKGTGAARNSAIKETTGDYLFFMDSDDEITPDCIEVLVNAMVNSNADLVIGSVQIVDEHTKFLKYRKGMIYSNIIIEGNENIGKYHFSSNFFGKIHTPMWNKLYDINFLRLNNIKCVENQRNEDIIFTNNILTLVTKVELLSNITYLYRLRENSTEANRRIQWSRQNISENKVITLKLYEFYNEVKERSYASDFLLCVSYFITHSIYKIQGSVLTKREKKEYIHFLRKNKRLHFQHVKFKIYYFLYLFILTFPSSATQVYVRFTPLLSRFRLIYTNIKQALRSQLFSTR